MNVIIMDQLLCIKVSYDSCFIFSSDTIAVELFSFYFLFIYFLNDYLFLAVLGLCCCALAFSS